MKPMKSREIFGLAARNRVVSETGMSAHGVQVKAIVASRPSSSERGILFQHYRVDAATLKGGGGGKAGRSGTDDHDGGLRHRSLLAQSSATIARPASELKSVSASGHANITEKDINHCAICEKRSGLRCPAPSKCAYRRPS